MEANALKPCADCRQAEGHRADCTMNEETVVQRASTHAARIVRQGFNEGQSVMRALNASSAHSKRFWLLVAAEIIRLREAA